MTPNRKKTPLRDLTTYGDSRAVRLDGCDYAANVDVHIALCADTGRPFEHRGTARLVCENIEYYCTKLGYRLYGYCLMPDHLHVLLSPAGSCVPLSRWLREFKSFTTNRYTKSTRQPVLWQRSAHDHVCRKAETAETVLRYIVENPVRAGLVKRWQDWLWTKVFIEL
jgi:REP element-mobilizing transposase RayT